MNQREFIDFLIKIEKLKCTTRHSWTSDGRHESVAEHSWRLAVMAMLLQEHFSDLKIDKVIKMCLIHDFGEAITGDIPAFEKTKADELKEKEAIRTLLSPLSANLREELTDLFKEMESLQTKEAKLFRSLDQMEAVLSHNEAPLTTWLPREHIENLTYGANTVAWSDWLTELKAELNKDSLDKIKKGI